MESPAGDALQILPVKVALFRKAGAAIESTASFRTIGVSG